MRLINDLLGRNVDLTGTLEDGPEAQLKRWKEARCKCKCFPVGFKPKTWMENYHYFVKPTACESYQMFLMIEGDL